jgi:hypothetical protein
VIALIAYFPLAGVAGFLPTSGCWTALKGHDIAIAAMRSIRAAIAQREAGLHRPRLRPRRSRASL